MVSPEILANNIRLLRTSKNLRQEDVAESILLVRSTYSEYESGTRPLDIMTLDALAALHDISLDSLLNYDLSKGLMNRIFFSEEHESTAKLLTSYQRLSVSSKFLISQMLNNLLEKELSLYRESVYTNQSIKKDTP